MESENKIVLDKIESIEALKLIKSEAEMVLDESFSSENIITNKANTIFQILVVMFFSLIAYSVDSYQEDKVNNHLIIICFILILTSAFSVWYLLKIMYPRVTFSKGTVPSKLLFDDIIIKDWEEFAILKNRIYCLEEAIKENKQTQLERINYFKKAVDILLFGFAVVVIYSLIILVGR